MLDKTTIYGLRATCAEDRDVGTARVRLPAQFCAANNIAYRKPVFVACNTSLGPLKALCIAVPAQQVAPEFPSGAAGSSATGDSAVAAGSLTLDFSVVAPSPAAKQDISQLVGVLKAKGAFDAELKPCSGNIVSASSVKLLVPEGLDHLHLLRYKLHQALIFAGCHVSLSDTCWVRVLDVQPSGSSSTVHRITPSTSLLLTHSEEVGAASASASEASGQDNRAASSTCAKGSSSTPASKPATAGKGGKPKSSQKKDKKSAGDKAAGGIAGELGEAEETPSASAAAAAANQQQQDSASVDDPASAAASTSAAASGDSARAKPKKKSIKSSKAPGTEGELGPADPSHAAAAEGEAEEEEAREAGKERVVKKKKKASGSKSKGISATASKFDLLGALGDE